MAEKVVRTCTGYRGIINVWFGSFSFQKVGNGPTPDAALAQARGQFAEDPYFQFQAKVIRTANAMSGGF